MIFLLFLFYQTTVHLKKGSISSLPDYFHFQANGTYSLSTRSQNISVDYLICTKEQYKKFKNSPEKAQCYETGLIQNGKETGNIFDDGVYQFIFYFDDLQKADDADIKISLKNPHSFLDKDVQPDLYMKQLFIALSIIGFSFWLMNWSNHYIPSFTIHEYITIMYFAFLSYLIISFFDLQKKNKSDDYSYFKPFKIAISFFFQLMIFSIILMAAKGWCIVYKSIGKMCIIQCFFVSYLFVFPQFLLSFYLSAGINYFIIILAFLGILYFYYELITSIDLNSKKLMSYFDIIKESGIDPSTTPIMENIKLYKFLSYGILIFLFFQLIIYHGAHFQHMPFYILQTISDINYFIFMLISGYIFKLRSQNKDNLVEEINNNTLSITDIEELLSSNSILSILE